MDGVIVQNTYFASEEPSIIKYIDAITIEGRDSNYDRYAAQVCSKEKENLTVAHDKYIRFVPVEGYDSVCRQILLIDGIWIISSYKSDNNWFVGLY